MSDLALHSFPYDPFQQRAIDIIDQDRSLFVAAPTGSGKTVLADYVIERSLQRGQRVIYTAPIKALSNQKFRDFSARHGEEVGIMTGDVTINPTAPLVIMTTEIYRNTLLEDATRLSRYSWIIFDEVHYLDDQERGTVWEESILFTPPHINLLALSATIPNVEQLAQWIRDVHQRPVDVIEETHRPVPLTILFQCQNKILKTLQELKQSGYLGRDDWRQWRQVQRYDRYRPIHANRFESLIEELRSQDRLPCIFFTFGRRRAEELAWEFSRFPLISSEEHRVLRRMFDELCGRFGLNHDRSAEALGHLIDHGIAFHHAGMLPTIKEVIERCFTSRLIKLIVTTETFALGVNMPARSVVLDTIKKRANSGFELLRRRDFQQMAGRAGRRGMDAAGFVYVRINPMHVTHPEVSHLLHGTPEPVHSRFNTTYATLLNLYRRHGRALLNIFPNTLYYYQTTGPRRQAGLEFMERKLDLLEAMGYLVPSPASRRTDRTSDSEAGEPVPPDTLTSKGWFASWLYGYELLLTELYMEHHLSDLDPIALATLLVAIVFEPRPRSLPPKVTPLTKRLEHLCQEPLARIHKEETRFRIGPKTKLPAFSLAGALDAWMRNEPFYRLTKLCDVDEGEIVRYFRMTVQLLRQLSDTPAGDPTLRVTAQKALRKINRDVIDAEAQLRMG